MSCIYKLKKPFRRGLLSLKVKMVNFCTHFTQGIRQNNMKILFYYKNNPKKNLKNNKTITPDPKNRLN